MLVHGIKLKTYHDLKFIFKWFDFFIIVKIYLNKSYYKLVKLNEI